MEGDKALHCTRCGGPTYNCTGDGSLTGVHTDLEECLRLINRRIADLEIKLERMEPEDG